MESVEKRLSRMVISDDYLICSNCKRTIPIPIEEVKAIMVKSPYERDFTYGNQRWRKTIRFEFLKLVCQCGHVVNIPVTLGGLGAKAFFDYWG
jgi:hypothetical protein